MYSPFASIAARRAFVVRVAELLQTHGTAAHRLEALVGRLCDRLGLQANVFSTPTAVQVAFEGNGQVAHYLRRIELGGVDLGKLVEFDEILDQHEAGQLSLYEAREALEQVAAAAPRYGAPLHIVAHGAASASAAVLFGGGAAEVAASFALGLVLAVGLHALLPRLETPRVFELGAAFVATVVASALRVFVPDLAAELVLLASIVVLLPGLTLTVAMTELATRHLASGTARLSGALIVLLSLTLGVALGHVAVRALHLDAGGDPVEPLGTLGAPLVALAPLAFAIIFRARPREFGWIFAATMVGLAAAGLGIRFLGDQLGPFAGAFALAVFSNAFARTRQRPASVLLTPGLLTLVPGSVGYRAANLFVADDHIAAVATAFDASLVAVALVGGMLIANATLPPRRSL